MRYRPFGQTGVLVSELCLGTMTFGGKGFWEVVGKLGAPEYPGRMIDWQHRESRLPPAPQVP